jgi:hypothetical protein
VILGSIVVSLARSGVFVDELFQRMGIEEALVMHGLAGEASGKEGFQIIRYGR